MTQYNTDPLSACCGTPDACSQAHLYCFNRPVKEADVDAMKAVETNIGEHQMGLTREAVARETQGIINAATHGSEPAMQEQMAAFEIIAERDRGVFAELAKDDIKRPDHYARFPIEPCTFIMLNELPYWCGNVVKYVTRAPHKHKDERIDIRKAIRYCEMRIEELDRVASGTDGNVISNPL